MINTLSNIASILGLLISIVIYIEVYGHRKFYRGKRYIEINKKRIEAILAISDEKKTCTSFVKKEVESILILYKQTRLPIIGKCRERKVVKEIERLLKVNGDTLHAVKQNLKILLADFESEDM